MEQKEVREAAKLFETQVQDGWAVMLNGNIVIEAPLKSKDRDRHMIRNLGQKCACELKNAVEEYTGESYFSLTGKDD